jgi:hypothetical protein
MTKQNERDATVTVTLCDLLLDTQKEFQLRMWWFTYTEVTVYSR